MANGRPELDPNIREGDVVVTRLAGNYMIGRVQRDGTRQNIDHDLDENAALRKACAQVVDEQRVFLYPDGDANAYYPINCANVPRRGAV